MRKLGTSRFLPDKPFVQSVVIPAGSFLAGLIVYQIVRAVGLYICIAAMFQRGFDLLLQFVELALLAPSQFLLNGLDLLVEVVLFLRLLHLPLHARLDGAIHVQFFDLDVEHVGDAVQALRRIENLQQFLLLFDGKLQVGGNDVGELGRIFHAHGRDHGFVIQRLAKLYILLKQRGHALHARFDLGVHFGGIAGDPNVSLHVAVRVGSLEQSAALNAFHQHLDVAIGQLEALHDVDDGADLVNLIGLGLVDGGIVLSGQKDFLVRGQRLFEGPHAGLSAHDERRHHVRKDDHVPDGHHGQLLALEFFLGCGHSISLDYVLNDNRRAPLVILSQASFAWRRTCASRGLQPRVWLASLPVYYFFTTQPSPKSRKHCASPPSPA